MGFIVDADDISVAVPLPHREPLVVVNRVSMQIESGYSYSIVGKSGSGKTSLLSVLGLLNAEYTGRLQVDGRDAAALSDREASRLRASLIGFVFQTYSLVPHLNALDNVMLPCMHAGVRRSEATDRARQALAGVGLGDRLDAKPGQLSGGEQQRVAIARAIVNQPQVVMADEPTGALDTDTGIAVMDILMAMVQQAGLALVIVTHDPEIARLCSRHYVMDHGHVRAGDLEAAGPEVAAPIAQTLAPEPATVWGRTTVVQEQPSESVAQPAKPALVRRPLTWPFAVDNTGGRREVAYDTGWTEVTW
ncbi:MAG: ABC transporter ATP-binding protein [Propionibacteriaceae bacterium]|nr:ABC transporter ATP-binding protein [Propionibacteriaceae bacterium]